MIKFFEIIQPSHDAQIRLDMQPANILVFEWNDVVYDMEDSSLLSQDASLLVNLFYRLVVSPRRTAIQCSSSSPRIFRPLFPLAALLPVQGMKVLNALRHQRYVGPAYSGFHLRGVQ